MSQAFDFCSETETLLKKRSDCVTFIWMVKKGQLNRWVYPRTSGQGTLLPNSGREAWSPLLGRADVVTVVSPEMGMK